MKVVSPKTSFFLYYNVFLRRIQEEMRIFCMVYIQILVGIRKVKTQVFL